MEVRPVGVPSGMTLAATYGSGIAPVGSSLALVPAGALPVPANEDEWTPPFELSEVHCQYVADPDGRPTQCRSWPKKSSPRRFCVGHEAQYMKRVNDGAEPSGDEGLHQDAPRP